MRHSIIRRSLILTTFYISGHGFYYLLLLIANAMLDPTGFVSRMLARIAAIALPWTAATVLVLEVLFYLGGRLIGADSLALILVLPLTAVSFLGVEIVRASLQGTLRFVAYGARLCLWGAVRRGCVPRSGGALAPAGGPAGAGGGEQAKRGGPPRRKTARNSRH